MKLLIATDKKRFYIIKQFADELTKYGIEYKLIDDLDIYDNPGVFHKYTRWIKTPKKFQRIINEFKPDAVFAERYAHFSSLVIKNKIPLWIYLGGDHWTVEKHSDEIRKVSLLRKIEIWYKRRIYEKCFRESDIIFVDDQYMTNIVKERYPDKKIGVMFQGINESDWIPDKKMDLKHPCVGLLQGSQIWGKTKEMFILPKILEEFPNVTFYWAGDGVYRDKILPILKKYKNFEWLGYLQHPDKVREYLASIDVYLLLTAYDTSPHSVLEAGLMKKAIIATDVGGVSEIIIDGKTGLLVEKGNYKEIIKKISILLNDEKKREQLGIAAYEFVKNNFMWKETVKGFISAINEKYDKINLIQKDKN